MTEEVNLNPIWNDPEVLDFTRATQVGRLPIRGEKRLVPVEIDAQIKTGQSGSEETGPSFEAISYAASTLTDYVTIRLPSRGKDGFTFRFLVNPHTVAVSRQTLDAHSMTRAGWQFGIWGEDTVDIHMSGTTAGEYFEDGLTDRWEEFSISYRNLAELMNVFENNGYYFEGEEVNQHWSAADFTRKRIKCHEDVELRIGNFIWYGMFTNMTVNHSADTPYFNTFELNFLAWKERFSDNSPWRNSIKNSVYRGHGKSNEQDIIKKVLSSAGSPISGPSSSTNLLMVAMGGGYVVPSSLPPSDSFAARYPGSLGVLKS